MNKVIVLGACLALNVSVGQQAAESFNGVWVNDNAFTRGITKVEIRVEAQALLIHVWGKCHPQDCDWGEMPSAGDDAVRRVRWNHGFAERDQEFEIGSDGRLTIITRTHFKDASGRPDSAVTEHMVKNPDVSGQTAGATAQSPGTVGFASLQRGTLEAWVPNSHVMGLLGDPTARVRRDYPWATLLNEFKRDFPNFDLRFKIMERDEFVRTIHSLQPDAECPDVEFVDNKLELDPLLSGFAVMGTSGQSRFSQLYGGWWLRFLRAKNVEAANAFMLWLSESPNWKPWRVATTAIGAADVAAVQAVSKQAVQAFLQRDPRSLSLAMDRDATHFDFDHPSTSVEGIDAPLIFGNSRLAFVLLSSTGVASGARIVDHWAAVLRRADNGWKVLLFLQGPLPFVERALKSFDGLELVDGPAASPPKLTLLAPADHAPISRYPRGFLEWAASGDEPPAAYVIEWQMGQPRTEFWSPSSVVFVPPLGGATLRTAIPFGVGRQPHRWRVWYISRTGIVSTSEWRTIDFTD